MAKRDRVEVYRHRLTQAMAAQGMTKSGLARDTHVDRSTIGQLFKADGPRLPNAQLAADIAAALGVSLDWLMGLTNRPERPAAILASAISLDRAERASSNDQILNWHREVAGGKVRHVPATLPEMLKTDAVVRWEYSSLPPDVMDQVVATARAQLDWMMTGEADYEIAVPLHEVTSLAVGHGYYSGLPAEARQAQLTQIAEMAEAMYPRLRLFLYDARTLYSAPVTVFANDLAIIYIGQFYVALRERQRVMAVMEHFDWLVRQCSVDAREVPGFLRGLGLRD